MQYQHFDTSAVSAVDQFEYARSWFGAAVDVPMRLEPIGDVPRVFSTSADVLTVGGIDVVEVRCGPGCGSWRREDTTARDLLRLAAIARGPAAIGRWHGHELSLAGGPTALLGRTGGSWHAPNGLRFIQVNLPRSMLLVPDAELDRVTDVLQFSVTSPVLALVRSTLAAMAGRLDEGAAVGVDSAEAGTTWLSLATLLVRSLAGSGVDGMDVAPARRLQAYRYIDTHLADHRLDPARVAAALHMSRRSLYTLLSADGRGVAAEIRRRRLRQAHALLSDPARRRSIHSVAAAVGLPDPAHFSRLFRAEYGMSPRQLRAATTRPASSPDPPRTG